MKSLISAILTPLNLRPAPPRATPPAVAPEMYVPDWSTLHPVLAGKVSASGNGDSAPVWRGEATVPAGTVLLRGCVAPNAALAEALLSEPRFWTDDREYALSYAKWASPSAAEKSGFLITARLIKPILVADMAMYPVAQKLYANPATFRIKDDHPQNLQRLYCSHIARDYGRKDYDGVIDHGLREILLLDPAHHIDIVEILEIPHSARGGA